MPKKKTKEEYKSGTILKNEEDIHKMAIVLSNILERLKIVEDKLVKTSDRMGI